MSMTCDEYQALSADPEAFLDEANALRFHQSECVHCAHLDQQVDASLSSWKQAPGPVPRAEVLLRLQARLASDAHAERLTRRVVPEPQSMWGRIQQIWEGIPRWAWAPALGLLVFSSSWSLLIRPEPPALGTRSVASESARNEPRAPALDLQAVVETTGENHSPSVAPAEQGTSLRRGSGLLFHCVVEGAVQVTLVERSPGHRLRVLHTWTGLDPAAREPLRLEITDETGQRLRYVPDGPEGTYTYLAVLDQNERTLGAAELDSIWNRYVERRLQPLQSEQGSDLLDVLEIQWEGQSAVRSE